MAQFHLLKVTDIHHTIRDAVVLTLEPENADATTLRVAAMRTLADQQVNACARNYYLLTAKQEVQPS